MRNFAALRWWLLLIGRGERPMRPITGLWDHLQRLGIFHNMTSTFMILSSLAHENVQNIIFPTTVPELLNCYACLI